MKKTFYLLFMFLGLVFTSCEPMDDIHNEIDAEIEGKVAGTIDSYTLTEDDYKEILGLDFTTFNTVEDAKELIPVVLNDVFPSLGAESSVNVNYNLYAPKRDEKNLIVYEATDADYATYGDDTFPNFDEMEQVFALIEGEFGDVENRTLVSLTYDFYDGGVQERNDGFLLVDGEWIFVSGFTDDEYETMGEGYDNFSNEDEAESKIPIFLEEKFKYEPEEEGAVVPVMYKLYTDDIYDLDGDEDTEENKTYSFVKYFIFDGSNWEVYNNVLVQSLQFGHDGTNWVPDNTIRYSLTKADFGLIGNALIDKYPGPGDNAAFFGSFDVRKSSDNYWSDEMLLEAFNLFLNKIAPNAEIGQKYVLSYAVYNGATVTMETKLIKTEAGWVINE